MNVAAMARASILGLLQSVVRCLLEQFDRGGVICAAFLPRVSKRASQRILRLLRLLGLPQRRFATQKTVETQDFPRCTFLFGLFAAVPLKLRNRSRNAGEPGPTAADEPSVPLLAVNAADFHSDRLALC
jgi:hypothetical protein